uniref:Insulin-like androgenic gland factor n=1 Tax=Palaemon paucidens TaxID=543362 RepID=F1SZC9_9EUCA|nr:insulin-like androgenic gland factor [Palaemon paucidens]
MAYRNISVKVFFCMVMAFYLAQPASSYTIECLSVDFDCGDMTTTFASICKRYNGYINPGPAYISKERRSVRNFTEHPTKSSPTFFHPRATHLTKADEETLKTLEMPWEISDMSLSRKEANTMLHSNRRHRRDSVRKTPREECCSNTTFRRCTYEEVAEYCIEVRPGVNTCSSA